MTRMVDADLLAGVADIAQACEVKTQVVYDWTKSDTFPAPVATFGKKFSVWLLPDVAEWLATRPVRPDEPKHGTHYRYAKLGCRCDECRSARAAYMRAYRHRRLAASPSNSSPVGADGGES